MTPHGTQPTLQGITCNPSPRSVSTDTSEVYPVGMCELGLAHMHPRGKTRWRLRVVPRIQTRLAMQDGDAAATTQPAQAFYWPNACAPHIEPCKAWTIMSAIPSSMGGIRRRATTHTPQCTTSRRPRNV